MTPFRASGTSSPPRDAPPSSPHPPASKAHNTHPTTMEHPQTPRVLQPHLSQFQHRIVRVLGKVVQLRGENAIIDAGGQIDVILNRVRLFRVCNGVLVYSGLARALERR